MPTTSLRPLLADWPVAATAYIALVVLLLAGSLVNPGMLTLSDARSQIIICAPVAVVALGQTMLILTGQIDLSVPWTMTFAATLTVSVYARGWGEGAAIVVALAFGALVGAVNAFGTSLLRVQSLVWTLAMNMVLEGTTLVYTNAQPPKSAPPPIAHALAVGRIGGIPVALLVWIVIAAAVLIVLRHSRFGRMLYATGINPIATFHCGIDVRRVYAGTFVVSGICSAFAGILLLGYTSEAYLGMGEPFLLLPIAAVVIGGTSILGGFGGYGGTIAGVLIVVVLQSLLSSLDLSQAGRDVVFGTIILLMVGLNRRGAQVG